MYVKLQDGQPLKFPYSLGELRRDNPGTSFAADIPDAVLAEHNVFPVTPTPAPTCDPLTHRLEQSAVQDGNSWKQQWTVVPRPEAQASDAVRSKRDNLLASSDWTQLPDSPLDADAKLVWQLYRETLRMVPQQSGFPWSVEWPPVPGT